MFRANHQPPPPPVLPPPARPARESIQLPTAAPTPSAQQPPPCPTYFPRIPHSRVPIPILGSQLQPDFRPVLRARDPRHSPRFSFCHSNPQPCIPPLSILIQRRRDLFLLPRLEGRRSRATPSPPSVLPRATSLRSARLGPARLGSARLAFFGARSANHP